MARLPHIYPPGATFFITFRLADSLPQHIVRELKDELADRKAKIKKAVSDPKKVAYQTYLLQQELFGKYEYQLDEKPYGDCQLEAKAAAQIVFDKILEYDSIYYKVLTFCIMPNHVHLLADTSIQMTENNDYKPEGYVEVSTWMQLIKGGSSFQINKFLGRKGRLWGKESFDHWIRNEESLQKTMKYIRDNPLKTGLSREKVKVPFFYVLDPLGS